MNGFLKFTNQPVINNDKSFFFESNPNGLMDSVNPNVRNKRYQRKVIEIINKNKDKHFVQRILDPSLTLDLGNGESATHRMAYDPKSMRVYPTVVQKGNQLVQLEESDEAYNYVDRTGEYIQFDNVRDAKKFASNGYKIIWDNEDNPFMKKRSSK